MIPVVADTFDDMNWAAFFMSIIDKLTLRPNNLLQFGSVMHDVRLSGQHDLGVQPVPVEKIVGTMSRSHDFDRAFRPRSEHTKQRWLRVYSAMTKGEMLPPVELYKVGECYFVEDGHHRVSVGRANQQAYIDAHIIEIQPDESQSTHACVLDN